jgi:hemerythrin-like domain-containing protein
MREHGVLNRVLLIYEEIIKKIERGEELSRDLPEKSITIIRNFIEDYHEKLEEECIFPLFEKNEKEGVLVKTLKQQHQKGRNITDQLHELVAINKVISGQNKKKIKSLLQQFIILYRPHAAREDTVLFPQVHFLISKKEFQELSEIFEDRERELFKEHGFEKIVEQVAEIEKELGIYKLEQFTPEINTK